MSQIQSNDCKTLRNKIRHSLFELDNLVNLMDVAFQRSFITLNPHLDTELVKLFFLYNIINSSFYRIFFNKLFNSIKLNTINNPAFSIPFEEKQ